MILARTQLIEAGDLKCLAGHPDTPALGDVVLVLRRAGDAYTLHSIPITASKQQLRSFLTADDSVAGELVSAILETDTPQRGRKNAPTGGKFVPQQRATK